MPIVRWVSRTSATILRYRSSKTWSGNGMWGNRTAFGRGNSGITRGSAVMPLRSSPRASAADDLDRELSLPGAVQLGRDDRLELAEHQLARLDRERERVPEEGGLEM